MTSYVGEQRRRVAAATTRPGTEFEFRDNQLSQLNQFLGRRKHGPADAVLRPFIPKNSGMGPESRSAAIWALGLIHEGKPEPALVSALQARLNDVFPMKPPETTRVRRTS